LAYQGGIGKVTVGGGVAIAIAYGRKTGGGVKPKGLLDEWMIGLQRCQPCPPEEVVVGVGDGEAVERAANIRFSQEFVEGVSPRKVTVTSQKCHYSRTDPLTCPVS